MFVFVFVFVFASCPHTKSLLDTEKKVELFASVATALARYDLPVPGGAELAGEQV